MVYNAKKETEFSVITLLEWFACGRRSPPPLDEFSLAFLRDLKIIFAPLFFSAEEATLSTKLVYQSQLGRSQQKANEDIFPQAAKKGGREEWLSHQTIVPKKLQFFFKSILY